MDQYNFASEDKIVQSFVVKNGKVYSSGERLELAKKGEKGDKGDQGDPGPEMIYQWDGTSIRVGLQGQAMGPWVNLIGPGGPAGADGESIKGDPGQKGEQGDPGVTPEEMKLIRTRLEMMADSIKRMFERLGEMTGRLDSVKDGTDGEDGKPGEKGDPGVEPEEMKEIGSNLLNMKEAIDSMSERVAKVKDGTDGKNGIDGQPGRNGESKQGFPGPQGEPGEPGIPPHDWDITLNNVAELLRNQHDIIIEFRAQGIEIGS